MEYKRKQGKYQEKFLKPHCCLFSSLTGQLRSKLLRRKGQAYLSKPEYHYFKEVKLPTPVKKKAVKRTYRNGILEVKLMKMKKDS